jgi:hypothetical protein
MAVYELNGQRGIPVPVEQLLQEAELPPTFEPRRDPGFFLWSKSLL